MSERQPDDFTVEELRRVSEAVRFSRRSPERRRTSYSYPADRIGNIYFIGPEGGPVKIGFAVNLRVRLGGLQVGSPVPLKIYATIREQPAAVEREYHARFSHLRLHGEWFTLDRELQGEIDRLVGLDKVREAAK